jgi:PAS domain S-box-containing protein
MPSKTPFHDTAHAPNEESDAVALKSARGDAVNQTSLEAQLNSILSELRKSQAAVSQLAEIVEQSVNEIYVCHAETYKIINANRAARNNLGYSLEEAATLTPMDIVVDIDRTKFEQLIEPFRTGALKSQNFETVHRRKDGTTYPVSSQLQFMSAQRPPVYLAIVQDITELKQREALLRQ